MGLFGWKTKKSKALASIEATSEKRSPVSSMLFTFDALPQLDPKTMSQRLRSMEALRQPLEIRDQVLADGALHARLSFNGHQLRIVGFPAPAPIETVQESIECSHWRQADKEPLRQHAAHMLCYYESGSDNPTEQIIAIHKVAGMFLDNGLSGVVDTEAWNCVPRSVLAELLTQDMLASSREEIPLGIWTGFAKMFKTSDEVWFCSKGFHRWGIKDFAYLGSHNEADITFSLVNGLFRYLRESGVEMKPGDTAQFGEMLLRFSEVTEYKDYLTGPLGTLAVTRITPNEVH